MSLKKAIYIFSVAALIAILGALVPLPVQAAPTISLSPRVGAPGTQVTISGLSFQSYAHDTARVFFNNVELTDAATPIPESGTFQATFRIPDYVKPGTATVTLKTGYGFLLAEATFTIPEPELRLNATGGAVSTTVTAFSRGFNAGQPFTLRYKFPGTEETIGSYIAGSSGDSTFQFNIPASPQGKHLFTARNEAGITATAEYEVIPEVTITPESAAAGDKVTVVGTGFPPDKEITLSIAGKTIAYTETQDRGTFSAQFLAPSLRAGVYLVTIKQYLGETSWELFSVLSQTKADKLSGEVGMELTLSGTGFEPSNLLTITYDSIELSLTLTDEEGSFSHKITVPPSNAGVHIITVTDGRETSQITFTMESQPPDTPAPLSPRNNTEVEAPLTFDWQGVYDVSEPIIYTFEIARDTSFFRPLWRKTGISATQLTLNPAEELLPNRKGTYYYWRVKAVDGAGNEGNWSEGAAFGVKPVDILPGWAVFVLFAIMAMLLIIWGILLKQGLTNNNSNGN